MSRFDNLVLEEWRGHLARQSALLTDVDDVEINENGHDASIQDIAKILASIETLSISESDKTSLTLTCLNGYKLGVVGLYTTMKGMDEGVKANLISVVNYLKDFVFTNGFVAGLILNEPNRRAVKATEDVLKGATAKRKLKGDPVRDAAEADIKDNPRTSQTACATRVARALSKDQRSVERIISPMFEMQELTGGRWKKQAKPQFVRPG